jgi:UrcA family protein
MSLPTLRTSALAAFLASAAPVAAQSVVVQPPPVVVQPPPVVVQQPPVVVQAPPEEIIIVGRYGPRPEDAESASTAISYADLDLSFPGDRKILRQRISLTARFLCEKLGETDTGADSCRELATRDALRRVGTIEQGFAPRGTAWVRPPPWAPPYPVAWVQQYP